MSPCFSSINTAFAFRFVYSWNFLIKASGFVLSSLRVAYNLRVFVNLQKPSYGLPGPRLWCVSGSLVNANANIFPEFHSSWSFYHISGIRWIEKVFVSLSKISFGIRTPLSVYFMSKCTSLPKRTLTTSWITPKSFHVPSLDKY